MCSGPPDAAALLLRKDMIDLIQTSLINGAIGSVGATLAIFLYHWRFG